MRRLFSATLLALFVVQSSGIASAAEYHHSGSVAWQMLNAQFRQSRLMALFDGQQTLFDLRQRVPHFTHITRQPILPDASISRRAVERFVGPGVRSVPVSMPKLPILPQNAPKDPLAMKRDAVSDAIVSGAGVQTIKHFTKKTASLTPMTTSQSYVTVAPSSVSGIAGGSASVATDSMSGMSLMAAMLTKAPVRRAQHQAQIPAYRRQPAIPYSSSVLARPPSHFFVVPRRVVLP